MNSKFLDIEQMKKAWIEMGKALGMETPPSNPDTMKKKNTDLDNLRMRYMKGLEASIIGGIIFTALLFWMPSLNDEYRISVAATFAILMFSNAYALYWLWRGTGKINPLTMSITQVASMAKHYKKCHLLYSLIGYPLGIAWTGYFIFANNRSEFRGMDGVVSGIIIGSICGLYGLWKYLNDYRNLSE